MGCGKECQQAGAELGQAGIGLNFKLIPVQLGVGGWCHNDIKAIQFDLTSTGTELGKNIQRGVVPRF